MNQIQGQSKYRKYVVDIKDFKIEHQIQSGGFGSIYSIRNIKTNEILAAKVVYMQKNEAQYKKMINREIGIMIRCQHPTIIKFIGYSFKDFNDQNNVAIFMELAKRGSLADLLEKVRNGLSDIIFDNTARQIILIGISYGMMHLHQHRVIHRDLKPGNILLDENLHPIITDFGLSKLNENGFSFDQSQQCGTSIYMAPEVFESNHYGEKADVYSFGILMFEVVTDSIPYPLLESKKMTAIKFAHKVIYEDYRPEFNVPVKKSIQKLIERCWSKEPKERPTFEELFKKLAYNIEDSIDDIYDKDADEESDKYYLEDVDVDEVLLYADDLENLNKSEKEQNSGKLIETIERLIGPLKEENMLMKNRIDDIQRENEVLRKTIEDLTNEQKKKFDEQNDVICQMKEELSKLKKEQKSTSQPKKNSLTKQANSVAPASGGSDWSRATDNPFALQQAPPNLSKNASFGTTTDFSLSTADNHSESYFTIASKPYKPSKETSLGTTSSAPSSFSSYNQFLEPSNSSNSSTNASFGTAKEPSPPNATNLFKSPSSKNTSSPPVADNPFTAPLSATNQPEPTKNASNGSVKTSAFGFWPATGGTGFAPSSSGSVQNNKSTKKSSSASTTKNKPEKKVALSQNSSNPFLLTPSDRNTLSDSIKSNKFGTSSAPAVDNPFALKNASFGTTTNASPSSSTATNQFGTPFALNNALSSPQNSNKQSNASNAPLASSSTNLFASQQTTSNSSKNVLFGTTANAPSASASANPFGIPSSTTNPFAAAQNSSENTQKNLVGKGKSPKSPTTSATNQFSTNNQFGFQSTPNNQSQQSEWGSVNFDWSSTPYQPWGK